MSGSRAGRLEWIGLAPAQRATVVAVGEATAIAARGLAGDHHATRPAGSRRQVTLIQADHLGAAAAELGRPVTPDLCRRNLVVANLDLLACIGAVLQVGEVQLAITGACEPCARMEENLGRGGFAALRARGGVTAQVLRGGSIRVGDLVRVETAPGPR